MKYSRMLLIKMLAYLLVADGWNPDDWFWKARMYKLSLAPYEVPILYAEYFKCRAER